MRARYGCYDADEVESLESALESARAGEAAALEEVARARFKIDEALARCSWLLGQVDNLEARLESALAGESVALHGAAALVLNLRALTAGGSWIWIGDEDDRLETMGDEMAVTILARDLRALLNEERAVERELCQEEIEDLRVEKSKSGDGEVTP